MKRLVNAIGVVVPEKFFDSARMDAFCKRLVAAVGGYTTFDGFGGWRGVDGTVVDEEVVHVGVAFDDTPHVVEEACKIIQQVAAWLLQQGEEAVMLTQGRESILAYKSDIDKLLEERSVFAIT